MNDAEGSVFRATVDVVAERLAHYLEHSADGRVIDQPPIAELAQRLDLERWIRDGGLLEDGLELFLDRYLAATTRLHHPGYLAHQVAVPHPAGGLAALVDAVSHNPMAIYEMGPPAATIEFVVLNWMLRCVGWRPAPWPGSEASEVGHGAGVLTHGGSLATLTVLVAARRRACPEVWQQGNPPGLAVLASPHAHYAVARAAGIMGLGRRGLVDLAVDARGAIRPDGLERAYRGAIASGHRPFALVANACSTPVGIYDPLAEIAAFCREHGLWLHVDGAHGAAALLSARRRKLLAGVEQADSLIWDAHKLLRTPALCAAVLVRDARDLDTAFEQEGSYIFHDKPQPGVDFIRRTVECTKAGIGLKLFFVLAALGERGLERYVDDVCDLTEQAWQQVRGRSAFETPARPESNILCFRVAGSDKLQLAIRDRLLAEGDFHISTTEFAGKRYLRIVVMNPRTRLETIRVLLDRVETLAQDLRSTVERS